MVNIIRSRDDAINVLSEELKCVGVEIFSMAGTRTDRWKRFLDLKQEAVITNIASTLRKHGTEEILS